MQEILVQSPGNFMPDVAPVGRSVDEYRSRVSWTLVDALAWTCRTAREKAGLKQVHIAAALSVDQSTIYRFEQGNWPRDPEKVIGAYAQETGIAAHELWSRAIKLYRSGAPPEREVA